jgi:hypothetical protein
MAAVAETADEPERGGVEAGALPVHAHLHLRQDEDDAQVANPLFKVVLRQSPRQALRTNDLMDLAKNVKYVKMIKFHYFFIFFSRALLTIYET